MNMRVKVAFKKEKSWFKIKIFFKEKHSDVTGIHNRIYLSVRVGMSGSETLGLALSWILILLRTTKNIKLFQDKGDIMLLRCYR